LHRYPFNLLEPVMKLAAALLIAASFASFSATGPVLANADDDAWIGKCIKDNSDQNQTADVLTSYCTCMNGKMSSQETLSITAWEKTHPGEEKKCSTAAGWKG
jgi:hypothetical protein